MTEPIKLPAEFQSGNSVPVERVTITRQRMAEILAEAVEPYTKRIAEVESENAELERLCDKTYVAQGADAYNHACEVMEHWQAEREKQGKVVGTTGSLCDGIAWLYNHIDELEADRQARGEPIGEVLAFPMGDKPKTHSKLAGLENPQPVGMLVYATPQPQQIPEDFADDLAQEIRRVDGNHSLGAAALAERLVPFLSRTLFEIAPDGQE